MSSKPAEQGCEPRITWFHDDNGDAYTCLYCRGCGWEFRVPDGGVGFFALALVDAAHQAHAKLMAAL